MGGAGRGRLGAVLSQMIFDRLRSTGAMVMASRKMAKNAMPKISSITAEMMIASKMTGITDSDCPSFEHYLVSIMHDEMINFNKEGISCLSLSR